MGTVLPGRGLAIPKSENLVAEFGWLAPPNQKNQENNSSPSGESVDLPILSILIPAMVVVKGSKMIRKLFSGCIMLALTLATASCIVHRVDIVPVDVSAETPILISSPVKAHLLDGSTVVFPEGVNVYDGKVQGKG